MIFILRIKVLGKEEEGDIFMDLTEMNQETNINY
jgi:hypothetical protein